MDDIEAIDLLKQGDISGLGTMVLKYQRHALRAAEYYESSWIPAGAGMVHD